MGSPGRPLCHRFRKCCMTRKRFQRFASIPPALALPGAGPVAFAARQIVPEIRKTHGQKAFNGADWVRWIDDSMSVAGQKKPGRKHISLPLPQARYSCHGSKRTADLPAWRALYLLFILSAAKGLKKGKGNHDNQRKDRAGHGRRQRHWTRGEPGITRGRI